MNATATRHPLEAQPVPASAAPLTSADIRELWWLTVAGIAAREGVSEDTVNGWIDGGELPARPWRDSRRVHLNELEKFRARRARSRS